ncbi:MAG: rubrerythrin [Alphaproteobacteria bacterium]|nr:rubrerythrin [Alphaproteobacteria bacterium]
MSELASINHVYTPKQKLNDEELLRAIKFAIVSEFEAIQIYQQIAEATNNLGAKRVLLDIAKEEKQHVGELRELLKVLSPSDEDEYEEGANETKENLEE